MDDGLGYATVGFLIGLIVSALLCVGIRDWQDNQRCQQQYNNSSAYSAHGKCYINKELK